MLMAMTSLREWTHTLELNSKQFKQPHQMSPEEFAAHPAAVFHGTYLPDEDVFNLDKRNPITSTGDDGPPRIRITNPFSGKEEVYEAQPKAKIHLGTFQAALERLYKNVLDTTQQGTVHTFWQTPKISGASVNQEVTKIPGFDKYSFNDPNPEEVAHYAPGSQYYENQNEDLFSASFATDTPKKVLASQADYVKAALDRGVPESEVHPRTLAQYKSGNLGKMQITSDLAKLMRNNPYKLGPLTEAGPRWNYVNSNEEGPERPKI